MKRSRSPPRSSPAPGTRKANIAKAKDLVRAAAAEGANAILIQELFETPYFCQDQLAEYFDWRRRSKAIR